MASPERLLFTLLVTVAWQLRYCYGDTVHIDLTSGVVLGYSRYINFVHPPSRVPVGAGRCSRRAVVRVDFSGPFKLARIELDFTRPRLWTVDLADSPHADGHGSDAKNATSNDAEVHVFNRQLRVHSNSLPGYSTAAIDGGHLLKVVDNVTRKGSRLILQVSDEKISWSQDGKMKEELESKFLFTLSGQTPTHGAPDYYVYAGFNRVVAGEWRSGSGLCKATIILQREEDECILGTHECDANAVCKNTRKSYRCHCKPGYEGNGKHCEDKNECKMRNGGCVHKCNNLPGNYSCSCHEGFVLDKDAHNCIDINECLRKKASCEHQCVNTVGSYECRCRDGYTIDPDGRTCNVGSWCKEQGCAHSCTKTQTSHVCSCRPGYMLAPDGRGCLETCALGNGGCQHRCTNTPSGPVCTCHYKYMLNIDKKSCNPTCSINNGGCDRRCTTTPQGYVKCSCPNGFLLHRDGRTCLDINECDDNNGGCSYLCQNSIGSFECLCPTGYKLLPDEKTCQEFDECTINGTCDHICINLPGSYECRCREGFENYGLTHCGDINECVINNGGCQHFCVNNEGSFHCTCRSGYRLLPNGKDCVELDPCNADNGSPNKISMACTSNGFFSDCISRCLTTSRLTTAAQEPDAPSYTYTCGTEVGENQRVCTELSNGRLCPDPSTETAYFHRRMSLEFPTDRCYLKERLSTRVTEPGSIICLSLGHLVFLRIKCSSLDSLLRHRKSTGFHSSATKKDEASQLSPMFIIQIEMDVKMNFESPTDDCDHRCTRNKAVRKFRQYMFNLKNIISNDSFSFAHEDKEFVLLRHFPLPTNTSSRKCSKGQIVHHDTCISCKPGTHFDIAEKHCRLCSPGTFRRDQEDFNCNPCPLENSRNQVWEYGATRLSHCGGQCPPGYYSNDGFEPCMPCVVGTFQPEHGRSYCTACGQGILTLSQASTQFQDCLIKESCPEGRYYDLDTQICQTCPKGSYQSQSNQMFCHQCPGDTTTDLEGATTIAHCKSKRCGGFTGKLQGIIESPNFPGNYPNDVECTWVIKPQKGRRILVVVPEIFLANDKCGDYLVMRKSRSPYSVTTYDTCKTQDRPIAFSARSRKLWIQFKADGNNNEKGFRIPYALFNEEYQPLIESIVRDSQLYAMINHQEILKDRKLLTALMDVIAHPINYYKYANISRAWFPDSFIRFIMSKVKVFFS